MTTPPTGTPEPDASITALKRDVTAAQEQVTQILRTGGEHTRPHREAELELRRATRALERAEHRAAERRRSEGLSPAEVADRVLGR